MIRSELLLFPLWLKWILIIIVIVIVIMVIMIIIIGLIVDCRIMLHSNKPIRSVLLNISW